MLDRHGWQFACKSHRKSNKWLNGIMACGMERSKCESSSECFVVHHPSATKKTGRGYKSSGKNCIITVMMMVGRRQRRRIGEYLRIAARFPQSFDMYDREMHAGMATAARNWGLRPEKHWMC